MSVFGDPGAPGIGGPGAGGDPVGGAGAQGGGDPAGPGGGGGRPEDGPWALPPPPGEVPPTAGDYDLSVLGDVRELAADGWDPQFETTMVGAMHKAKLSRSQVHAVLEAYAGHAKAQLGARAMAPESGAMGSTQELRNEWGSDFSARITSANRVFLKIAGGPDKAHQLAHVELADGTRLGDFAPLIRFLGGVAERIYTDMPGAKGGPARSATDARAPIDARDEIQRLQADPEFLRSYLEADDPRHAWAVRKITELTRAQLGADADRPAGRAR